jgi:hypothetical protein
MRPWSRSTRPRKTVSSCPARHRPKRLRNVEKAHLAQSLSSTLKTHHGRHINEYIRHLALITFEMYWTVAWTEYI